MARHEGQTVRLEDMETTANRTFVAHDVELTTCLYIVCDMAYVDKQLTNYTIENARNEVKRTVLLRLQWFGCYKIVQHEN